MTLTRSPNWAHSSTENTGKTIAGSLGWEMTLPFSTLNSLFFQDRRETQPHQFAKNTVPTRRAQEYSRKSIHRDARMIDEQQIRKQVLVRQMGSPLVLAPLLFGVTSLTAAWAFDWKMAGIAAFAGIAGIMASGGIFLTRLILGGQQTAANVIKELESDALSRREKELDRLERELETSDNDPRPEKALRDLRSLVHVLKESALDSKSHQTATMVDIHAKVTELFEHCVELLEQTIQLWKTAAKLNTETAKKPILAQRETIIEDIQQSVQQVSNTLVGLKQMNSNESSTARLKQMRVELDQSLDVARTVEERVNRLMRESDSSNH
jgi:hypothetical protein